MVWWEQSYQRETQDKQDKALHLEATRQTEKGNLGRDTRSVGDCLLTFPVITMVLLHCNLMDSLLLQQNWIPKGWLVWPLLFVQLLAWLSRNEDASAPQAQRALVHYKRHAVGYIPSWDIQQHSSVSSWLLWPAFVATNPVCLAAFPSISFTHKGWMDGLTDGWNFVGTKSKKTQLNFKTWHACRDREEFVRNLTLFS